MKDTALNQSGQELVIGHLKLARSLARQFYRQRGAPWLEWQDLESAAVLGLCEAARAFDPERSTSFSTYAHIRIRGEMFDLLRRSGMPRRNRETQRENGGGPAAGGSTLPRRVRMNEAELFDRLGYLCFGNDTGDDLPVAYAHQDSSEHSALRRVVLERLRPACDGLSERQRQILRLVYGEDLSYEEIGERINGGSRSWLCRLHLRALESLRTAVADDESGNVRRRAAA